MFSCTPRSDDQRTVKLLVRFTTAMNIETMKVFCNVVQKQSFSLGAAASDISQSAATQCVQRLEEEVGTQLIDRRKRPLMITPSGQICYREFCKIIENYEALLGRLEVSEREIGGTIRVAAIYSVGLHGLGHCMQQFMRSYPKAKVQLEYLRPNEVYEAVETGRAQFGVVSYPSTSPDLAVIPLRSEEMLLACRCDHPLAGKESISLTALAGEEMIGFDRDLPIRKEIDRCLRQRGVSVRMVMEFDNIETIKQAIEIGAGVSILPEPTVCKEVKMGTLSVVRFNDCALRRPIGVIHRDRLVLSPTMAKFLELLERMPVETLAKAG